MTQSSDSTDYDLIGVGASEPVLGFQIGNTVLVTHGPGLVRTGRRGLAAAGPTVERVEALCRLLVDEGHMTAEGQRQVVALWGAL